MPDLSSYDYAFIRVTPRQESAEFVNVGVILYCRTLAFLDARIHLNEEKVRALDPDIDCDTIRQNLEMIPRICAGEGPIGELGQAESFHWLVAPHNTVVHASPVHTGLCNDPQATLERLMQSLL